MGRCLAALAALAALTMALVVACSDAGGGTGAPAAASGSPDTARAEPTPRPMTTGGPDEELCVRVVDLGQRLAALRAVVLRLPNRDALDIELDRLRMSYGELRETDLGAAEDRLEGSLKRLGYRLDELELAVEDFRTNPRPRRAAPHVAEDAQKVADELDAFTLLSRC